MQLFIIFYKNHNKSHIAAGTKQFLQETGDNRITDSMNEVYGCIFKTEELTGGDLLFDLL